MSPRERSTPNSKKLVKPTELDSPQSPRKSWQRFETTSSTRFSPLLEALERGERYFMVVSAVGTGKSRTLLLWSSMNGFFDHPKHRDHAGNVG